MKKVKIMRREIKFRGKRKDNSEWVYGPSIWQLFNGLEIWIGKSTGDWKVDPKTVGQFTGIKDKNGKDIYEGDRLLEGGDELIVKFGVPEETQFAGNSSPRFHCILDDGSLWDFEPDDVLEIIGNIHENPEMINP